MRRFGALLLLTITALAGCGGRESPVSPDEAPETALTEQDVINMYTAASAVYDWFDLTTLPLDMEDARTEGDLTYYRVDAENLSSPVSTVAELTDSALPWQPRSRSRSRPWQTCGRRRSPTSPRRLWTTSSPCPRITTRTSTAFSTPPTGAEEQPVPAGQDRGGGAGGCGPLDGDGHLLRRQLGL